MAAQDTAILSMPYIMPSQAQKHVTHNEAIKVLDVLVQLAVLSKSLNAAPSSPAEGDRYIVGPAPTGVWAGLGGKVVAFLDGVWEAFTPQTGWVAAIVDQDVIAIWTGSTWRDLNQALPMAGINATADTTNRLSVSSDASLFNNAGNGHQMKINKAGAGDTASVVFQTGFSGRAEFGLAGSDDFSVKVSADGSAWSTAITVDAASGLVVAPEGLKFVPIAKASLPTAAAGIAGTLRYVSDATGGPQLAYCDGSAWLKVSDGGAV